MIEAGINRAFAVVGPIVSGHGYHHDLAAPRHLPDAFRDRVAVEIWKADIE